MLDAVDRILDILAVFVQGDHPADDPVMRRGGLFIQIIDARTLQIGSIPEFAEKVEFVEVCLPLFIVLYEFPMPGKKAFDAAVLHLPEIMGFCRIAGRGEEKSLVSLRIVFHQPGKTGLGEFEKMDLFRTTWKKD